MQFIINQFETPAAQIQEDQFTTGLHNRFLGLVKRFVEFDKRIHVDVIALQRSNQKLAVLPVRFGRVRWWRATGHLL